MKKNKLLTFLILVGTLGISDTFAQSSVHSSGGNFSGATGSVSYSVGQTVYTTNTGATGSIAQGVQQPFEITKVLTADTFSDLVKELKVFPNPTTENLTISLTRLSTNSLDYEIIDTNGKLFKAEKGMGNETNIDVSSFPAAIYFLKIKNQNQEIKTYKIIKK